MRLAVTFGDVLAGLQQRLWILPAVCSVVDLRPSAYSGRGPEPGSDFRPR